MQEVQPKAYIVAETRLVTSDAEAPTLRDYFNDIGVPGWCSDAKSDAEELMEIAGRGCYRSFALGLNANVTRIREGNDPYLANIKGQEHGSVFEHSSATFIFMNCSRVFTHELVRHRVGTAMSQESLRFVRLDDLRFWFPTIIAQDPEALARMKLAIAQDEEHQKWFAEHYGLDNPGVPFDYKKEVTSAMRRVAPDGLATMIMWTGNFRTLRHCLEVRTSPGAEEEIRLVFGQMGAIAQRRWPAAFGDYRVEIVKGHPHFITDHRKI